MRGDDPQQAAIFSYLSPEERVPQDHPLRAIRVMVDAVLQALSPQLDLLFSHTRRPSNAPETLPREPRVAPHVVQHTTGRSNAIGKRIIRHSGYAVSQPKRTSVEESFGRLQTVGLRRKARHRGAARVGGLFTFAAAVYNLVRMRTLAVA